jgi:hypothetical protein
MLLVLLLIYCCSVFVFDLWVNIFMNEASLTGVILYESNVLFQNSYSLLNTVIFMGW